MNKKYDAIMDYIIFHENVAVADICASFDTSERTVRRLLTRFEKAGLVKRYHGGAHIVKTGIMSDEIVSRGKRKNIIKMNIAKVAAGLVKDGDVIILLGGTTVFGMCEFLMNKKITIITNSMAVFSKLHRAIGIEIVLLGGLYDKSEMETRGVFAPDTFHRRANSVFVGAVSISPEQGVTTNNLSIAEQYISCVRASNSIYVLADSSKFRKTNYPSILRASEITAVITDKVNGEIAKEFSRLGTSIYTVNDCGR